MRDTRSRTPDSAGSRPDASERNWALAAHLACLAGFVFPFGNILGPLAVLLLKRDSAFVGHHAQQSVLFQLFWMIGCAVLAVLTVVLTMVLVGLLLWPVLIALYLCGFIYPVVMGIRASNGEWASYAVVGEVVARPRGAPAPGPRRPRARVSARALERHPAPPRRAPAPYRVRPDARPTEGVAAPPPRSPLLLIGSLVGAMLLTAAIAFGAFAAMVHLARERARERERAVERRALEVEDPTAAGELRWIPEPEPAPPVLERVRAPAPWVVPPAPAPEPEPPAGDALAPELAPAPREAAGPY